MRISYEKYPVIKNIYECKFDFETEKEDECDINELRVKELWIDNCQRFTDIKYITLSLWNAIDENTGKLYDAGLQNESIISNGTFVYKVGKCVQSICYDIEVLDGIYKKATFYSFQNEVLMGFYSLDVSTAYINSGFDFLIEDFSEEMNRAFNICLFLKFAEIETKILLPNKKINHIKCKHLNETCLPVKIIDCTWFTNLVKSDSFRVGGHFRLQACGTGLKERKLIWINDFVKNGYTAPARKLKHESTI